MNDKQAQSTKLLAALQDIAGTGSIAKLNQASLAQVTGGAGTATEGVVTREALHGGGNSESGWGGGFSKR